MTPPLDKLRVLDMSRILAGPWATQLLGDYGADVVKLERPNIGDDTRQWGPPWLNDATDSAYFLSANRNKRSITVDFSTPSGQAIVRELAGEADVLIENYKVGTMARYGLGPDTLMASNRALIYCSISAYGQTGSRATEPGYDAMIQASAGLMSITGPGDGGPQKVGVAIADIMAGMYATTAVLAALNARAESGRGQYIDVPLYDTQVAALANQSMNCLVGGEVPKRMGTAHPNLVPYQTFATRDGDLMLAVGNDRQFAACCRAIGQDDLANDERFRRGKDRVANREALISLIQERLLQADTRHWLSVFSEAGIPAGAVNDIGKVLGDDYASERGIVRSLRRDDGVDVPTVANPVRFDESDTCYDRAPPRLGEHTDEVLREWLRYSDAQLAALRADDVI